MAWVMPTTPLARKISRWLTIRTVAGRAGRPLHDVELGLLVGKGDGGHHVGEQVHGEDASSAQKFDSDDFAFLPTSNVNPKNFTSSRNSSD